jgi:uncharacterized membrane protein
MDSIVYIYIYIYMFNSLSLILNTSIIRLNKNRSDFDNGPSMASWQIALIVVPCAFVIIGAGLYFYRVKQLASLSKSKGDVEQAQGVSLQPQNPIKQIP